MLNIISTLLPFGMHKLYIRSEQSGGENMDLSTVPDNRANLHNFPARKAQETSSTPAAKLKGPCSARPMAKPAAPITAILRGFLYRHGPRAATAVKSYRDVANQRGEKWTIVASTSRLRSTFSSPSIVSELLTYRMKSAVE